MPGREKLYICSDVDLPVHPRILACEDPGGCLGLWQALTAYSREHLTDGRVPKRYAAGLWGDKRNLGRLADLVRNELLSESDAHYTVLRYAPRNQTKAMVDEAREKARLRMRSRRSGGVRANTQRTDGEHAANNSGTVDAHPADVPSSSSGSEILDPREPDRDPEAHMARPAAGRLPPGVVQFEKRDWITGYERAVDAARRPRSTAPYTFPEKAFGALVSVVEKHCQGDDRKNLGGWVERTVGDFVRAVDSLGEDIKLWSSYGPDGLLRWFNEDRKGHRAQRPGPARVPPVLVERPTMSHAENATAVRNVLAGIGYGGTRA